MDASQLLRTVRRGAGLTLRELATRAGTSDSTLSAYESGRVVPRVDTLTRIVRAAGYHVTLTATQGPVRDPRRAPPGEELWQALLLAERLPGRPRGERSQASHAVFGRS